MQEIIGYLLKDIPEEWHPILSKALSTLPHDYLIFLKEGDYLPDNNRLLNAFKSLKPNDVKYILFGQDPYPRRESATGYAFIDGRVNDIFSSKGLSKEVNRATSLRNFIKTLLVIDGYLSCDDTSQEAISGIDKSGIILTIDELKDNLLKSGVLLLNSALVYESKERSKYHIKIWRSFTEVLLDEMSRYSPSLILFGTHAKDTEKLLPVNHTLNIIRLEHPYNTSFICNEEAHRVFGKMRLLSV